MTPRISHWIHPVIVLLGSSTIWWTEPIEKAVSRADWPWNTTSPLRPMGIQWCVLIWSPGGGVRFCCRLRLSCSAPCCVCVQAPTRRGPEVSPAPTVRGLWRTCTDRAARIPLWETTSAPRVPSPAPGSAPASQWVLAVSELLVCRFLSLLKWDAKLMLTRLWLLVRDVTILWPCGLFDRSVTTRRLSQDLEHDAGFMCMCQYEHMHRSGELLQAIVWKLIRRQTRNPFLLPLNPTSVTLRGKEYQVTSSDHSIVWSPLTPPAWKHISDNILVAEPQISNDKPSLFYQTINISIIKYDVN